MNRPVRPARSAQTGARYMPHSIRSLHAVARAFHDRVVLASFDSLTSALIHLHQPYLVSDVEWPVCQGCDRDDRDAGDAVWPCRTYTTIAMTVLKIQDIEAHMTRMRVDLEQRNAYGEGARLL